MANFSTIFPIPIPSSYAAGYVAKVLIDLYRNRETLIDAYETTLEQASEKIEEVSENLEPAADAFIDVVSTVADFAKDLIRRGGLGTGRNHLLTWVKDPTGLP